MDSPSPTNLPSTGSTSLSTTPSSKSNHPVVTLEPGTTPPLSSPSIRRSTKPTSASKASPHIELLPEPDSTNGTDADVDAADADAEAEAAAAAAAVSSSSTRIIESLHDNIDTLTNTNLKLTVQSHKLLENLESFQKKELKLAENISRYNREYENLNMMLQRRVRKINEIEKELEELRTNYDTVNKQNESLRQKIDIASNEKAEMREKLESLKGQYMEAMDAQRDIRGGYVKEIGELSSMVGNLRMVNLSTLTQISQTNKKVIGTKIDRFKLESSRIMRGFGSSSGPNAAANIHSTTEEIRDAVIENQVDLALRKLDTQAWVNLFKLSRKYLDEYREQNELDRLKVPSELDDDSKLLESIEEELRIREDSRTDIGPMPTSSFGTIAISGSVGSVSSGGGGSSSGTSGSSGTMKNPFLRSSTYSELPIPKLRSFSGNASTTLSPNSRLNIPKSRKSYYNATPNYISNESKPPGLPAALPGVKRSASLNFSLAGSPGALSSPSSSGNTQNFTVGTGVNNEQSSHRRNRRSFVVNG